MMSTSVTLTVSASIGKDDGRGGERSGRRGMNLIRSKTHEVSNGMSRDPGEGLLPLSVFAESFCTTEVAMLLRVYQGGSLGS